MDLDPATGRAEAEREDRALREQLRALAEANAALTRDTDAQVLTLAESIPALVWLSGPDRLCHFFNQRWLAFTGRTMEQERGDGWAAGVHPDDLARCLDIYVTQFDRRLPFSMEYRLRRHDGEYRWLLDNGAPRFRADGGFAGYTGACIDIHEEKLTHQRLLQVNDNLQEFASIASHDLQSPLRTIVSFLDIHIRRETRDGRTAALVPLEKARDAALRMRELVLNILEYAKIGREEGAGVSAPLELSDAGGALAAAQENLASLIADKDAEIVSDYLPSVHFPAVHLVRVFQNLLANALIYSPGVPRIRITAEHQADGWAFSVRDNGHGISDNERGKLFRMFHRGQQAHSGSGIGLASCKKILEIHDGRLWLESTSPEGTDMRFFIRRSAP